MSSLDSIKIIKQYIRNNHVFTLCTTRSLGDVWCANCFYWFDESQMRLVFLSEKKTRHAQMMQENLLVAGGISTQEIAVSDLQGIQFTGSVALLAGRHQRKKTLLFTLSCRISRHPCAFMGITITRN